MIIFSKHKFYSLKYRLTEHYFYFQTKHFILNMLHLEFFKSDANIQLYYCFLACYNMFVCILGYN